MELSGDLSDFALTDILQILSLSRKTGTLLLESGDYRGRLVIEDGCITHASLIPGETLIQRLIKAHMIPESVLMELSRIGDSDDGIWSLDTLLIESGILRRKEYEVISRRYIEDVVASLMALDRGRFWLELNQVVLLFPQRDIRLSEGLEVEEVLLEVARTSDENSRNDDPIFRSGPASDNFSKEIPVENWIKALEGSGEDSLCVSGDRKGDIQRTSNGFERKGDWDARGSSRLCSLLMELRSHTFEAEVSLLIMRYASEGASRGILFVVKENKVVGLGQFGITNNRDGRNPEEVVRGISYELGMGSILDTVINSGQPYIGELPEDAWLIDLLKAIGGGNADLSLFLVPVNCRGRTVFLVYGDNYPGFRKLENLDELVAFTNQAGIVLEKILLEKILLERIAGVSSMG